MTPSASIRSRADLRQRLIDAANRVFVEEGYDSLSMRRVAQEAGCSQMATYRHFANKEALTQHLCAQLYEQFTARIYREMEAGAEGPWERLRIFISSLIRFAVDFPDHYSLIFLIRQPRSKVPSERERLGLDFLKKVRRNVQDMLPADTPAAIVELRLRQLMTCLHGTAALLIAHPNVYRLTKQKAIQDTEATFQSVLGCPSQ
jgi:AcrR family transcriptional regulator